MATAYNLPHGATVIADGPDRYKSYADRGFRILLCKVRHDDGREEFAVWAYNPEIRLTFAGDYTRDEAMARQYFAARSESR